MNKQPKHNDIIVHCGHFGPESKNSYFYDQGPGAEFGRPDGTRGTAQWFVVCKDCYDKTQGDIRKVPVAGDTRLVLDNGLLKPEVMKTSTSDEKRCPICGKEMVWAEVPQENESGVLMANTWVCTSCASSAISEQQ